MRDALEAPKLTVISGYAVIEYERCGYHDLWTKGIRCPINGSLRSCGRLHAYPTLTSTDLRQEQLRHVYLGTLIAGAVTGESVPYRVRLGRTHQFSWVPADAYDRSGWRPARPSSG